MKSKPSETLKDLRAQRESIYGRRFANQNTPLDWMRLAKETLPNATPLTPEERVSINEFFGPTSNEPSDVKEKGVGSPSETGLE
jgi:hypothetical protein